MKVWSCRSWHKDIIFQTYRSSQVYRLISPRSIGHALQLRVLDYHWEFQVQSDSLTPVLALRYSLWRPIHHPICSCMHGFSFETNKMEIQCQLSRRTRANLKYVQKVPYYTYVYERGISHVTSSHPQPMTSPRGITVGCNWGMQIDWWLQPRAVFGHIFSGIIWHMPQKWSQFNCMTLSWWPCHKIVSVTLHYIKWAQTPTLNIQTPLDLSWQRHCPSTVYVETWMQDIIFKFPVSQYLPAGLPESAVTISVAAALFSCPLLVPAPADFPPSVCLGFCSRRTTPDLLLILPAAAVLSRPNRGMFLSMVGEILALDISLTSKPRHMLSTTPWLRFTSKRSKCFSSRTSTSVFWLDMVVCM